jgi:hypothetical protein
MCEVLQNETRGEILNARGFICLRVSQSLEPSGIDILTSVRDWDFVKTSGSVWDRDRD